MQNEEIVKAIQTGCSRIENYGLLYEKNRDLILSVARPLVRPGVELDDLMQEGYFAIVRAADQYDEQQGSFTNYAGLWVKWWLVRYIQNNGDAVRIPAGQRDRIRSYKRLCSDFERDFGRLPTSDEITALMELTPAQIENVRRDAMLLSMGSLDAPVEGLEEEQAIVDTIPDDENNVEGLIDDIQRQELAVLLWSIVDGLRAEQAFVLRERYQHGETLASCAGMMGKSTARCRQIEKEAFRQIRCSRNAERLRSFLDDRRETLAYHHNGLTAFRQTGSSGPEWAAMKLSRGWRQANAEKDAPKENKDANALV